MALNLQCLGTTVGPTEYRYEWKDVVLYALGIGAKRDELDYLYEGRGPKVYPSFAVVPTYAPIIDALLATGGSLLQLVHGHQKITLHQPIPPSGLLRTTATVQAIYDLRRMAQVILVTRTVDEQGRHLFDTEWGTLFLGEGGFNGAPPPPHDNPLPQGSPSFRIEDPSLPEQSLLYRLLGDINPLHADPDFPLVARFKGQPILHGLCTYGFMTRALVKGACAGDASRIRHLEARFTKPVWPGNTLVTEGWIRDSHVQARTYVQGSPDPVLTHVHAELV
jgi:acyl dehydratase